MTSILDKIVAYKKIEVAEEKKQHSLYDFEQEITLDGDKPFLLALQKKCNNQQTAIIAEVKKASPSKGVICENFDYKKIATKYSENGACCLSVLTDKNFFQGNLTYLKEISTSVKTPLLRKDFIIDPYQIYQSKAAGAHAILLIASILSDQQLKDLYTVAHQLELDTLCEAYTQKDMERIITLTGSKLVGVNNRNLDTFKVDINHALDMKNMVSEDTLLVVESGISSRKQIEDLQKSNLYAFLIGSHLMQQECQGRAIKNLLES